MASPEKNNDKDWKKKYFNSLKEIEASEKKWEKIEELLRLGISRLTLIADSTENKKLNDQIELLRKSIREGTESNRLVLLIENISEDIKKLPDAGTTKSDKKSETNAEIKKNEIIPLLESILDSIIITDSQKPAIQKFQKTLGKTDTSKSDEITQKFSSLISDLIEDSSQSSISNDDNQEIERRKDNRAVEELDKDIDRSIDAKKNSLVAPAVGELILQLMSRFPPSFSKRLNEKELARAASSARNRKDLLKIIDNISQELSQFIRKISSKNDIDSNGETESDGEILIHLLQRISLPDYLSEQALKLKQDIEKGDSKISITSMVEETADLIMQMRLRLQSEKQELEQFLSEISKHLKALDIDIQITSRLRDESVENLHQYDDDLEKEVRGLETGIEETEELEGLKGLVVERVKTIRLHMGAFRKSEEQRNNTAQETIKKLTNRISDMEQETENLREQVAKEHNSAVRDALTKIPNRLAYEERIHSEIERCKRYKSPMAFVVWDIDHFKGINDHYGHIAGDKVLAVIAEVLRQNLRAADFIARYGGEEFVVIMPETEIDQAEKGCEKIRLAIENCNFHYRDTSVPITASCGYTAYQNDDSKESLFERADKALYKAKQTGRNKCVQA
jgi:diguanylate cyclase